MAVKILYVIYFFLCLLTNFVLPYKITIPFYILCGILFFFLIEPKNIFKKLKELKNYSFKYIYLLLIWVIITYAISIYKTGFDLSIFINSFVGGFIFSIFVPFLITNLALDKSFLQKSFLKILFIIFYAIFVFGIIQFVAYFLHINIIDDFFQFLNNKIYLDLGIKITQATASGIYRVKSIFTEPSNLAGFIVLLFPVIYGFSVMKDKLFKNKKLDNFLKKSFIALAITNLLLTQAPISIVFGLILLLLVSLKNFTKNAIKILLIFASIIILLCVFEFLNKDIPKDPIRYTQSPLTRITTFKSNITDFNKFIVAEPSLATRIIIYEASIEVFKNNYWFGVGYGNSVEPIYKAMDNLKHNITEELKVKKQTHNKRLATSIIYRLLAETGFIGVILFFLFLISLYIGLMKTQDSYKGNMRTFVESLKYYIIILSLNSFYDIPLHRVYVWLFLAIAQVVIINANATKKTN